MGSCHTQHITNRKGHGLPKGVLVAVQTVCSVPPYDTELKKWQLLRSPEQQVSTHGTKRRHTEILDDRRNDGAQPLKQSRCSKPPSAAHLRGFETGLKRHICDQRTWQSWARHAE